MLLKRQQIVATLFGEEIQGLICSYAPTKHHDVVAFQATLKEEGFLVGAIRPPTVQRPILRIIPRLANTVESFESLCHSVLKEDK